MFLEKNVKVFSKALAKKYDFPFRYKVIALHSILSTHDQAAAFTLPPPGVRKVRSSPHTCVPSLGGTPWRC